MAEPTLFDRRNTVNPYVHRYPNVAWRSTLYADKFRAGMTIKEIAADCGVTEFAVRDGLRRVGLEHRQSRGLKVKLSPTQLAYIAGLIDGEGCIFINHRSKSRRFDLHVSIDNTDPRMSDWLRKTIQYGFRIQMKAKAESHWNDGFKFTASGRYAADLIAKTLPYLVIKRDQAAVALEFQRRKSLQRGRRLTPSDLQLYESFRQKLKGLKLRNQAIARRKAKELADQVSPLTEFVQ
jgi:transposase